MYKYRLEHHAKIARILESIDADFIEDAECYFAGGTAIVMLLDEYRESVDIDFLCSSREGYSKLRSSVAPSLVIALVRCSNSQFIMAVTLERTNTVSDLLFWLTKPESEWSL
ncbi:nucleotidyl transferase AbiEii/AbiGii toxin family protein [Xenorhabdus bovienii]|uniref:nucleotidyl transferase AbiEii/AbiGii toxin family protein n=1 Tax=Xenorhabdus bovienii TaxID=40576 RepID=UPI003DA50BB3